jgi:hypothetical protein
MLTPAARALIWVPGPLVWCTTNFGPYQFYYSTMLDWTPSDQTHWHDRLHRLGNPEYIIKDVLDTPTVFTYLYILFTAVAITVSARYSIQQLKTQLFHCLFATTLIIRSLSIFSGQIHYTTNGKGSGWLYFLPWNPASPFKGLLLAWVIELFLWDYTFLGSFSDPSRKSKNSTPGGEDQMDDEASILGRSRHDNIVTWHDAVIGLCNGGRGEEGLHCLSRDESRRAYEASHLR